MVTEPNTARFTGRAIQSVTLRDDLSKVLDNATITGDPVASLGDVDLAGTDLTWDLGELSAKSSQTVTCTVKVKPFQGSVKLVNVVAPSTPGGDCLPGECSTTHSGGGLPVTGAQVLGIAGGALLLLTLGGVAVLTSRRKRGSHAA